MVAIVPIAPAQTVAPPQPTVVEVQTPPLAETPVRLIASESGNDSPENSVNSTSTIESSASPLIGPVLIRGYPKAKPVQSTRKPRRKGKCMVATDTPEKNEIQQREEEQALKKAQLEERKRKRLEKAAGVNQTGANKKKGKAGAGGQTVGKKRGRVNRVLDLESEDSDEADNVTEEIPPPDPNNLPPISRAPEEGEYVLVQFPSAKETTYYVGKVLDPDDDGDMQISYLRKKICRDNALCFGVPPIPDLATVNISDVKVILPKPTANSATRRQQSLVAFQYDFSMMKLG